MGSTLARCGPQLAHLAGAGVCFRVACGRGAEGRQAGLSVLLPLALAPRRGACLPPCAGPHPFRQLTVPEAPLIFHLFASASPQAGGDELAEELGALSLEGGNKLLRGLPTPAGTHIRCAAAPARAAGVLLGPAP